MQSASELKLNNPALGGAIIQCSRLGTNVTEIHSTEKGQSNVSVALQLLKIAFVKSSQFHDCTASNAQGCQSFAPISD